MANAGAPHERIYQSDLISFASLVGRGYRALPEDSSPARVVADGFLRLKRVRPGLVVHASDMVHRVTSPTRLEKPPGLTVSVVLAGGWHGKLGRASISCGGREPEASFISLAEPETWSKAFRRGGHARMVNIIAMSPWIDDDGAAIRSAVGIRSRHDQSPAFGRWRPSPALVGLARRIIEPPRCAGFLGRLQTECLAVELLAEAMSALAGTSGDGTPRTVHPGDRRRLKQLHDLIEDGAAEALSLADMARSVGMSVSSLQRKYRAIHGTSVVAHVRQRHLMRAHRMLEQGYMVSQAAYEAGYTSPANFATAFRRLFGKPPREVRRQYR
jgi:AraC-like DNA-binding protein